jgi:nicotinate-nucleotide pyrophosphorylase (carboxylating)
MKINKWDLEDLIIRGLKEDMPYCDLATDYLIDESQESEAMLIAKESGVISGIEAFKMVFKIIDDTIQFKDSLRDGDKVSVGDEILKLNGSTQTILKGERLALNLLQRMSGIATLSNNYADAVEGVSVRIVDTRKTTPTLRFLEKYSVTVGGCLNHRFNLSDAMMIKDNHIAAVGSITEAVKRGRSRIPHTATIEVEVKNLVELAEALEVKADIIMLDNMSIEEMKEAVKIVDGRAIVEASGGVNLDTVRSIASTGVDVISVGALTHSYRSLDISLLIQ